MFSARSAADGIPGWRAGLTACEGEVADLRLQAGAPTKEDQETAPSKRAFYFSAQESENEKTYFLVPLYFQFPKRTKVCKKITYRLTFYNFYGIICIL